MFILLQVYAYCKFYLLQVAENLTVIVISNQDGA